MMNTGDSQCWRPVMTFLVLLCILTTATSANEEIVKSTRERKQDNIRSNNNRADEIYSTWSPWSQCNSRCIQRRQRDCLLAQTCGRSRHKEERSCNSGKCRQAGDRELNFRVVRISKRKSSGGKRRQSASAVSSQPPQLRLFGKWSHWSPCSKSCKTRRYRWCKKQSICGNDVEAEEAFCYIKGSLCQDIIFKQIRHHDENNEADVENFEENMETKINNEPEVNNNNEENINHQCGTAFNITNNSKGLRIIGGKPAVRGKWPWQVAVLNRFKEAFCGGTLISPQWVITAAHCVRKRLYVRIGEHNLDSYEGSEVELKVEKVIKHPYYDSHTVDNDLALLKLPGNGIKLDKYKNVACIPKTKNVFPTNKICTIIGWGRKKPSDLVGTKLLHEAEIHIIDQKKCRAAYEDYYITGNMFCAGHPVGRMDSCAGDSGGPLLCNINGKWTIYGITSFGESCGKKDKFGIYTKVPNYIKWIQRVTGIL